MIGTPGKLVEKTSTHTAKLGRLRVLVLVKAVDGFDVDRGTAFSI